MSDTPKEKRLREQIKNLATELEKVKNDRDKFRRHFLSNLRCAIDLLGKNQTWNMPYVVKTLAEQMTSFEKWWWGC